MPFAATLAPLLPGARQTLLLRAALQPGEAGGRAWREWCATVGDPTSAWKADRGAVSCWLPLLYETLRGNGESIGRDVEPYLKAAQLREELRADTCHKILATVLRERGEVPILVLPNTELATTVYPRRGLRHVHAIELLVEPGKLDVSHKRLVDGNLAQRVTPISPSSTTIELRHPSGLPIVLQSQPLRTPGWALPANELWARRRAAPFATANVYVLSPADALLHVCAAVIGSPARTTLQWVCDAWYLVTAGEGIDWDTFLAVAERSNLAPPLSVLLDYLGGELKAPIPAGVVKSLGTAAERSPRIAWELAWQSLRRSSSIGAATMLRQADSWRARTALLKWIVLPSGDCLRRMAEIPAGWPLPLVYVCRPLRYAARRMRQLLRGPAAAQ